MNILVRVSAPPATRTGHLFQIVMITAALTVGALQMCHIHGGLLTDYGADAFGTAWVYATMRLGRSVIQRGRPASARYSAIVVFLLCLTWELGQRAHVVPGRFDPFDIMTYAVTLGMCWAIDRRSPFVEAA